MKSDIRDNSKIDSSVGAAAMVHFNETSEKQNSSASSTILCLQHAVEELIKVISNSGLSGKSTHSGKKRCWLHNGESHDITECNLFLKYIDQKKINTIKENSVCFKCLRKGLSPGHVYLALNVK